jgi:TM2 domain-containing membrane protein YozV
MLYSQNSMASPQINNKPNGKTPKPEANQGFVYLPLLAGWLVPGAGHFLLGKWGRGALLAVSIIGMYAMGLAMQGKLYSNVHDILDLLGLVGDLGNGLLFIIGRVAGLGADQIQVTVQDWGTRFIVVSGLLNVIAAVDAHNIRTGRKAA